MVGCPPDQSMCQRYTCHERALFVLFHTNVFGLKEVSSSLQVNGSVLQ